ncbi:YihY/virulence factor BrkB family protein [Pseudonocardia sichuanensis]
MGPRGPVDASARPASGSVARVLRRLVRKAWDDDVLNEAAAATFWQTLSLPPLLLGLFGVLGYVGDWFGPDTVVAVQQWIIDITSGLFSRNAVDEILVPTVAEVLTTARGEVVSVGFVLTFWSGSSAMASFVDSITKAHDQYPVRGWLWQRTLSILLYLVGLAIGIVLLPVAALGPDRVLPLLPDGVEPAARAMLDAVYYPVVGLVLVLALTTLYRIALPHKMPWWRGLPGALLAAVVFLVGVTGLRWYLDWITSTGYTYGALAAPIAFLLGLYFVALAVILGAHLNAAIQAVWPAPLLRRGRPVRPPSRAAAEPTAPPAPVPEQRAGGSSGADVAHPARTSPQARPR